MKHLSIPILSKGGFCSMGLLLPKLLVVTLKKSFLLFAMSVIFCHMVKPTGSLFYLLHKIIPGIKEN